MFHAAVFDLDGTLIDSSEEIAAALNSSLVANGFAAVAAERIKGLVGIGIESVVVELLPAIRDDRERVQKIVTDYRAEYRRNPLGDTHPYTGIPDLLHELVRRGVPIAILTNKEQAATETVLQHFFPDVSFALVVGSIPSRPSKPDPAGAHTIIEQLALDPQRTVYVGDTEVDIATAKNARFYSVGVGWGFRSIETLTRAGADRIVGVPGEILDLLPAN